MSIRRHLSTILLAVFGVILIATILIPPRPLQYGSQHISTVASGQSDLPTIVHVILDAHIGVDGIPQNIEGGPELRRELIDFYVGNGFRVYGRAYSKHFESILSISELLNRDKQRFEDWVAKQEGKQYILNQNDYFDELASRGYRIRIYESDYLVYCSNPKSHIESCHRATATSVRPLSDIDLPALDKAKLLLAAFAQQSRYHPYLALIHDGAVHLARGLGADGLTSRSTMRRMFSTLEAPKAIDQLVSDIETATPGRVFFAHILLPHAPYVFESDCEVRRDTNRWFGRRFYNTRSALGSPEYRRAAYELYFRQVRCATSLLSRVFAALKEAGLWDDATIVVHGDHGSRISLRDPIDKYVDNLTSENLVDMYSAHFAIQSPGLEPGYDPRVVSIQDLFSEYFFAAEPKPDDGIVYTMGIYSDTQPMPIQMVPIGTDLDADLR